VVHAVRHVRPGETRDAPARDQDVLPLLHPHRRAAGLPRQLGDFRLIAGPALAALRALPERNRFVRGLVSWVGFRQTSLVYERDARYAGTSKYPLRKLVRLGADGVTSFSTLPLHLAIGVGLLFSLAAFLAIPVIVVLKLAGLYDVSGIASITVLILLMGGVQLGVPGSDRRVPGPDLRRGQAAPGVPDGPAAAQHG
jgi:dolichol-phosphate mannosyltransferase